VLEKAKAMKLAGTDFVFPSVQSGNAMSDMALLKVLRDADEPYHVHGFRSSFRDWVSEETNFPGDVAEAALAHMVANKVEAAYRRGNLLEKRRRMMDAWGAYCDGGEGKTVVPFRKKARH
jgi:integrase